MIYLYLAGRNKKGMKLVTLFQGQCPLTRLTNVAVLDLPRPWHQAIEDVIRKEQMRMEAWIESAESPQELQRQMKSRGYKDLPILTVPMFWCSSIPTGNEAPNGGEFRRGNYPAPLDEMVLKKLHIAHVRREPI